MGVCEGRAEAGVSRTGSSFRGRRYQQPLYLTASSEQSIFVGDAEESLTSRFKGKRRSKE